MSFVVAIWVEDEVTLPLTVQVACATGAHSPRRRAQAKACATLVIPARVWRARNPENAEPKTRDSSRQLRGNDRKASSVILSEVSECERSRRISDSFAQRSRY